jgi:hypothetical protein
MKATKSAPLLHAVDDRRLEPGARVLADRPRRARGVVVDHDDPQIRLAVREAQALEAPEQPMQPARPPIGGDGDVDLHPRALSPGGSAGGRRS